MIQPGLCVCGSLRVAQMESIEPLPKRRESSTFHFRSAGSYHLPAANLSACVQDDDDDDLTDISSTRLYIHAHTHACTTIYINSLLLQMSQYWTKSFIYDIISYLVSYIYCYNIMFCIQWNYFNLNAAGWD